MTITKKVCEQKFKPTTPLTPDQRMWLSDIVTSLNTWFAYQEKAANVIKTRLYEIEIAIREGKECDL